MAGRWDDSVQVSPVFVLNSGLALSHSQTDEISVLQLNGGGGWYLQSGLQGFQEVEGILLT